MVDFLFLLYAPNGGMLHVHMNDHLDSTHDAEYQHAQSAHYFTHRPSSHGTFNMLEHLLRVEMVSLQATHTMLVPFRTLFLDASLCT